MIRALLFATAGTLLALALIAPRNWHDPGGVAVYPPRTTVTDSDSDVVVFYDQAGDHNLVGGCITTTAGNSCYSSAANTYLYRGSADTGWQWTSTKGQSP